MTYRSTLSIPPWYSFRTIVTVLTDDGNARWGIRGVSVSHAGIVITVLLEERIHRVVVSTYQNHFRSDTSLWLPSTLPLLYLVNPASTRTQYFPSLSSTVYTKAKPQIIMASTSLLDRGMSTPENIHFDSVFALITKKSNLAIIFVRGHTPVHVIVAFYVPEGLRCRVIRVTKRLTNARVDQNVMTCSQQQVF